MPHTPGPWYCPEDELTQRHDADRSIYATVGPNRLAVGRAYGEGVLTHARPERIANARLIAAAPELAETLREIFRDVDARGFPTKQSDGADTVTVQILSARLFAARVALAKAGL